MKIVNKQKSAVATTSWISPKTQKGLPSRISGRGLFAIEKIKKDEVIVVKAGRILDKDTFLNHRGIIKGSEAQIADGLWIAPLTEAEFEASMAYVNHSCEPNAGFGGNVLVVAMRDIQEGEEITIDYAMEWSDPDLELNCVCGNTACRQRITGDGWKSSELQKKYAGYFSWYIEKKIKAAHGQIEL